VLSKNERLKKNSEFNAVYNIKRSVANSLLILYTGRLRDNPETPSKVGFVVSKKIHKRSTRRNLIKRRMKEAYKKISRNTDIPVKQWDKLIFLARSGILEVSFEQVYDAMVDCLKKANKKYHHKNLIL